MHVLDTVIDGFNHFEVIKSKVDFVAVFFTKKAIKSEKNVQIYDNTPGTFESCFKFFREVSKCMVILKKLEACVFEVLKSPDSPTPTSVAMK